MIYLLDLGNTRLKIGRLAADHLSGTAECRHRDRPLSECLAELLPALTPQDRLVGASVAGPGRRDEVDAWCESGGGVPVEWVVAQAEGFGVRNAYAVPERLGVDRWLALVAARSMVAGAACVVDCGSAITVDAIAADGRHLGGLILPGLEAMGRAVRESAPGLAEVPAGRVAELAENTADALASGPVIAAAAVVARVVGRLRADIQSEPVCLVAGGDSGSLLPWLDVAHRHVPDLVLQGLARVARGKER